MNIGCVSYLNAKPLIFGLDTDPALSFTLDVPARLLSGLQSGALDVALLPVIDLQRMDGLRVIPAGGIGCDGPTLTVRIFSSTPIVGIKSLGCDLDSHTSVALARVILAEQYGIWPRLVPDGEAKLLIGDKVVVQAPHGMDYQLDLGEAWKRWTGLPFVFAVWTAREGVELGDLPKKLEAAKKLGLANVEKIVENHAVPLGWPPKLAMTYLTSNLRFDIGERELRAMRTFFEAAALHRIIPSPPRPLNVVR